MKKRMKKGKAYGSGAGFWDYLAVESSFTWVICVYLQIFLLIKNPRNK
jgi:hypothetical protein